MAGMGLTTKLRNPKSSWTLWGSKGSPNDLVLRWTSGNPLDSNYVLKLQTLKTYIRLYKYIYIYIWYCRIWILTKQYFKTLTYFRLRCLCFLLGGYLLIQLWDTLGCFRFQRRETHGVEEPAKSGQVGTSFKVILFLPGSHEDEDCYHLLAGWDLARTMTAIWLEFEVPSWSNFTSEFATSRNSFLMFPVHSIWNNTLLDASPSGCKASTEAISDADWQASSA